MTDSTGNAPATLRVAVVLYRNDLGTVWRCVRALNRAVGMALDTPGLKLSSVSLALGDCSDRAVLSERDLGEIQENLDPRIKVDYTFFAANLGHSAGCNALAEGAAEDVLLLLNPDTYVAPTLVVHLLEALRDPTVAAVDGRQIPCEHPKYYDERRGDQSWASGACLAVRTAVYHEVGGFDAEWFPSYVNDVDLSWRIRLRGHRVVHEPKAVLFHDKRLDEQARVRTTAIEPYAGILGRLVLATRYGREDVVKETIDVMRVHGSEEQRRAVAEFEQLRAAGKLPEVVPNASDVAEFIDGEYGRRRF
ncbi:hypothetical protein SUDANB95_06945 [Actinosynnema sp. ALI-1.44]